MPFFKELLQNTAGSAVQAGMGLLLQGAADRRQLKQQQKLQAMQIAGQKEMTDYNYGKQLQMWKDTNYSAQKEQLEMAGLNPGLMYGMGGGGGQSMGSGSGASVSGASAPVGGGEIGMAMQLGMMNAQKAVLEADAKLKNAQADKTSGVDTKLAETQTMNLAQGIENAKAQEELTQVQTQLQKVSLEIANATVEESIQRITAETGQALSRVTMLETQNMIDKATANDKISTIRAEMLGAFLKNAMTKAQTANTEQDTKNKVIGARKTEAEISDIIRQGVQRWKALDIQSQNADSNSKNASTNEWVNDMQKSTGIPMEILREAVDGVLKPRK